MNDVNANPAIEDAAETAGTRIGPRFRLTVGRKAVLCVALAVCVGIAVLMAFQLVMERRALFSAAAGGNRAVTELLASQVSGGIKWNKAEVVSGAYARLSGDPASNLAAIVAFDKDGKVLTTFQSDKLPAYGLSDATTRYAGKLDAGEIAVDTATNHYIVVAPVFNGKTPVRVGTLAAAWSTEALNTHIREGLLKQVMLAAGLLVAMLVTIGWFIGRTVTRPIAAMTDAMSRLAGGDEETGIPSTGRRDEIGDMAHAVQVFKDGMIQNRLMHESQAEKDRQAAAERDRAAEEKARMNAERAADAERQRQAAEARTELMSRLTAAFDTEVSAALGTVSSASEQMNATARSMNDIARQTTQRSMTVASAIEQASQNVETVAAASEELSKSVQEIARQVSDSSTIASGAVDEAVKTNEKVQGLAEAAGKIGEVVNLINDIASQTNLLALNATIEAARAGDAGKGFAVVASEVKSLANQTARATEEIAGQIGAIQTATEEAVGAIEHISTTIGDISEIATGIASAVEEQSAAINEIARNAQQAAHGTQTVSGEISSVSEAAEQAGSAAGEVLSAAGDVAGKAGALQQAVQKFLTEVRAA
jgi:methyl-accepting chemotaxis protein